MFEARDETRYRALLQILSGGATLVRKTISASQKTPWMLKVRGEPDPIIIEPRLANRLIAERAVEKITAETGTEHYRISRQGRERAEAFRGG
ncbi:hypothetical protein JKG47_10095 [Acidithiobacillus sp. MC6.1]|nr:hypothetical protein [Acidithiobacillus sp. MC6.1]